MRKRLAALFLAFCLLFSCAPAAYAVVDLRTVSDFYAKQLTGSTCTLASAAMMLRRRAYQDGLDSWNQISESSLRRVAWSYVGLSHEFSSQGITVLHATFDPGVGVENQLIQLLKEHPEGIVVYNKSVPHAILVTDYTGGQFYCADPSTAAPSGRIPVSAATISITNARYYWYVAADTNRPVGVSGSLTATDIVYPTRLTRGSGFTLAGQLTSPGNITSIQMTVRTDGGTEVLSARVDSEDYQYDLAALAGQLDFAALNAGSYTLQLTVDDEYGGRINLRKQLTVSNGETTSASYSGSAPEMTNVNAVNLTQTGFDVESTATDEDGSAISVLYSAWADGEQFAPSLVADRDGETFTTHITADAGTLGIDSFLINITVMDADGNSARGALLVKVGISDPDSDPDTATLVADQTVLS